MARVHRLEAALEAEQLHAALLAPQRDRADPPGPHRVVGIGAGNERSTSAARVELAVPARGRTRSWRRRLGDSAIGSTDAVTIDAATVRSPMSASADASTIARVRRLSSPRLGQAR